MMPVSFHGGEEELVYIYFFFFFFLCSKLLVSLCFAALDTSSIKQALVHSVKGKTASIASWDQLHEDKMTYK